MNNLYIKEALPENATTIWPLLLELYAHLQMGTPKIDASQLSEALKSGDELAAYALYFTLTSREFGKMFMLEDIYVKETFRRQGIGKAIFSELSKLAFTQQCPFIECKNMTNNSSAVGDDERLYWWRIEENEFAELVNKTNKLKINVAKIPIVLDGDVINLQQAKALAGDWISLLNDGNLESEHYEMIKNLSSTFMNGEFGAIFVEHFANGQVIGMALFSRRGFSTWHGQFLYIDQIFVRPDCRRKGIGTAMVAELVKIAQFQNIKCINWRASDNGDKIAEAFFNSICSVKSTENLIYRWHIMEKPPAHCSATNKN
uniref:N-acetyltransferase domain-containing protein n=1 Tax=Globodera rostochiensis TaxID=31243 RepID=A0A914I5J2_GLORO